MTLKSDDDGRTTVGPDGLTTTRKFHIRITGVTFWTQTPEQEMEDMLRYDNGVIEELITTDKDGNTRVHMFFTADIWSERYTPERWHSFGLSSTPLNGPFHNNDGNGYIYQTFTRDNT